MALRMKMRRKPSVGYIISAVVSLVVTFMVGNQVLTSVGTSLGNFTGTPFQTSLTFLGLTAATGAWTTTGIVSILGLAAVASFVLAFIKISFR